MNSMAFAIAMLFFQWVNVPLPNTPRLPNGRPNLTAPVPKTRDGKPDFAAQPPCFLQHLGLYAYRRSFLLELAHLPPAPLELVEKLEQLRVLAAGRRIAVGIVEHAARGVDTITDYDRFVAAYRRSQAGRAA